MFPVVVPTGIYREPWVPLWAYEAEQSDLAVWMTKELTNEIEHTGVRAGFIKLSATDDGMTKVEEKILRAACESAKPLEVVIGSHTIKGSVVSTQLDIIEEMGYRAERFIWIHAHLEQNFDIHLEMAKRGCWIEYDGIGWDEDKVFIDLILKMIEEGYTEQLLISQDRGWFDPAQVKGGSPKPYTYFFEEFIPKLKEAGVSDSLINQLIHKNPFKAFSREIIE
jgi:phosphotriesterase-related protein